MMIRQLKKENTFLGATMKEFTVKPNNSGFVEGVDHLHLNRLIDELAVEDFIAKNS